MSQQYHSINVYYGAHSQKCEEKFQPGDIPNTEMDWDDYCRVLTWLNICDFNDEVQLSTNAMLPQMELTTTQD